MKLLKKLIIVVLSLVFFMVIFFIAINSYVRISSSKYIYRDIEKIPKTQACLVLGAAVFPNGNLSTVLKDRVDSALILYNNGKFEKILLSGDNGKPHYNEVSAMRHYVQRKKFPDKDIFLDHAGFNTYNSMVRAKEIFCVDDVIICTQEFHLYRSIYIARKMGLNAYGYVSDRTVYADARHYKLRELAANIKAFFYIHTNKSPVYLGEQIPISGTGFSSWGNDEK
ncbi:MAG: YdcF family protein [Spirochaetales bacterium]|nr:YdcF family protein [Spirochaetales bacterium]